MYELKYTDESIQDIYSIFDYISHTLNNKKYAFELLIKFENELKNILKFPYSINKYETNKKLENHYRRSKVKNFEIIYMIDEKRKYIIVYRIVSKNYNIENILI